MTTSANLTLEDFTHVDLYVPLLLAQENHVDEIALAVSTLDEDEQQLYMRVNQTGHSYDDGVKTLSRERGLLVQQIERDIEGVRCKIVMALIEQGNVDVLALFTQEIEAATAAAKKRTTTYVFAVMGSCGDYYCENEHLVGIYTDERSARAVAGDRERLKRENGSRRFDEMEVVRLPLGEVLPHGELTVHTRAPQAGARMIG